MHVNRNDTFGISFPIFIYRVDAEAVGWPSNNVIYQEKILNDLQVSLPNYSNLLTAMDEF